METPVEPTLYDRLGGVYNVATVIDDFIDRVMTDSRLNANPHVDEAHHRVSPAGFKYYVTECSVRRRVAHRRILAAQWATLTGT
jgi:hemoglobin